jgi:hypothetical protein
MIAQTTKTRRHSWHGSPRMPVPLRPEECATSYSYSRIWQGPLDYDNYKNACQTARKTAPETLVAHYRDFQLCEVPCPQVQYKIPLAETEKPSFPESLSNMCLFQTCSSHISPLCTTDNLELKYINLIKVSSGKWPNWVAPKNIRVSVPNLFAC